MRQLLFTDCKMVQIHTGRVFFFPGAIDLKVIAFFRTVVFVVMSVTHNVIG